MRNTAWYSWPLSYKHVPSVVGTCKTLVDRIRKKNDAIAYMTGKPKPGQRTRREKEICFFWKIFNNIFLHEYNVVQLCSIILQRFYIMMLSVCPYFHYLHWRSHFSYPSEEWSYVIILPLLYKPIGSLHFSDTIDINPSLVGFYSGTFGDICRSSRIIFIFLNISTSKVYLQSMCRIILSE